MLEVHSSAMQVQDNDKTKAKVHGGVKTKPNVQHVYKTR